MLYQPSNITPDLLSGAGGGVVDATKAASVTWQVNGNSALTKFSIAFYQNNSSSTAVWSTGAITVSPAFYGRDAKGNITPYTYNFGGSTWTALGGGGKFSNGNSYKLVITQYYNDGTEHSVTQYSASAFITRSEPTVSIATPAANSVVETLTATYSQAQGDAIAFARWILSTTVDGVSSVIEDTGYITTGVLSYDAEGLINGRTYTISCEVVTVNGQTASDTETFTVSTSTTTVTNAIEGGWTKGGAVELKWAAQKQISGTASGTYSISGGILTLASGASVTYDKTGTAPNQENISFVPPWSVYLKTTLSNPFSASANPPAVSIDYPNKSLVAVSKDGTRIAVFDSIGMIKTYSYSSGNWSSLANISKTDVTALAFGYDGRLYVGTTSAFAVYHYASSAWTQDFISSNFEPTAIATNSADGTTILVSSNVVNLVTVNASSVTPQATYTNFYPSETLQCATMSADGKYAVVGTSQRLFTFEIVSGTSLTRLTSLNGNFTAVCAGSGFVAVRNNVAYVFGSFTSTSGVNVTQLIGQNVLDVAPIDGSKRYALLLTNGFAEIETTGSSYGYMGKRTFANSGYTRIAASSNYVLAFADSNAPNIALNANTDAEAQFLKITTTQRTYTFKHSGQRIYLYFGSTLVAYSLKTISGDASYVYMRPNAYNLGISESAYTYTQGTMQSVVLYGAQQADYLNVLSSSRLVSPSATPTFDADTYLLAKFDDGTLNAGTADFSSGYLFREAENAPALSRVVSYTPSVVYNELRDYGTRACAQYKYELFFFKDGGATVSQVLESDTFCRALDGFYLYEAVEDENDPRVYHVIKYWRFNAAYSVGTLSNGNNPKLLENFTPYPLRQKSHINAYEGTLECLLGAVENNAYADTTEMMNELKQASVSQNTFFLKDPKGLLLQVHTSAPIQQSVNYRTTVMQVSVQVPFREVGDASTVSLIQVPTDAGWGDDAKYGE